MIEPTPIPPDLVKAANIIHNLAEANATMEQVGDIMAKALKEIIHIKGEPTIQVARTIAQNAINDCAELIKEATKYEIQPANHHPGLCRSCTTEGAEEHEAKHLPGRASGPRTNGEQGDSVGDT